MRVLLIAYSFPPAGGVGAIRPARFAQYLPEHGWDVTVLTAANPSVPITDEAQAATLPAGLRIERARTLEPSYSLKSQVAVTGGVPRKGLTRVGAAMAQAVLQPDPQALWMPAALASAGRVLKDQRHDVVLATGPPFSSFLLGATVASRAQLPLVLDYRDEWHTYAARMDNLSEGPVASWTQRRLERRVLRRAKAVVTTTPSSATELHHLIRRAGGFASVSSIVNGYEPHLHPGCRDAEHHPSCRGPLRLVYAGTLAATTTIRPLVDAMTGLERHYVDRIELTVVGRRTSEQDELLDTLPCRVIRHDPVPHHDVPAVLGAADCLLACQPHHDAVARVRSSKLVEYLASGRPILAIAGPGEARHLLEPFAGTHFAHPDRPDQIQRGLIDLLSAHDRGELSHVDRSLRHLTRRALAGDLAEVLDGVA